MRYFTLTLLISIYTQGYCQCEVSQISYTDANGEKFTYRKLDSMNLIPFYHLNDTLLLDFLYDSSFTKKVQNPFNDTSIVNPNLQNTDSLVLPEFIQSIDTCVTCYSMQVKIIDSADINKDGVKELFLYREWNCYAPYFHRITYNSQSQRQRLGQYEIWDVKSNKKIFEVKNICESSIPVTVNVMTTVGYSFDLKIGKNGSIMVPRYWESRIPYDPNPEEFNEVTYIYNVKTKRYEKK